MGLWQDHRDGCDSYGTMKKVVTDPMVLGNASVYPRRLLHGLSQAFETNGNTIIP